MRAGDLAVEIGDSGDHRGPGLGRRIGVWPVVAARMEAEASGSVQSRNAALAQIRFHDCARNRLRHGEQSPRGFRGSQRQRRSSMSGGDHRLGSWKLEEASRLVDHVTKVGEAATFADDVEKVAVVASGGVGPFAGGALSRFSALQPDEERTAGRVANVADQPVAALAASIGQIAAAHRLGVARETARQFRRLLRHGMVSSDEKSPPSPAGSRGRGCCSFGYSAAIVWESAATGLSSAGCSSSAMANSPPTSAVSSPVG